MRMMRNTRSGKLAVYDAVIIAESDGRWVDAEAADAQAAQSQAKPKGKGKKAPGFSETVGVTDEVKIEVFKEEKHEGQ